MYPNQETRNQFGRDFGACRWIYNHALHFRTESWLVNKKYVGYHETARDLVALKKLPEYAWLKDANSQCLQQSLRHLDSAYAKFFSKKAKYPNFKKKFGKQSFTIPQRFMVKDGKLHLPKYNPIRMQRFAKIDGKIKHVTVSMVPSGKYYASFTVEVPDLAPLPVNGKAIGIDLGIKDFLTTSDGEKVGSPKLLKLASRRLRLRQRVLSRKMKGSRGRERQKLLVARSHEKVSNQRQDFLHKLSMRLIRENQTIAVESLNVKEMLSNRHLAKAISDQGWGNFLQMLRYKSKWYGRTLLEADMFFPSSKRCSVCGWIKKNLQLSDRSWKCESCKTTHDRDINAAKNILQITTAGIAGSHAAGDGSSQHGRKTERVPVVERGNLI